jgi:ribosomal protein S18 acetylase RimI-like enzyme
MEYIVCDFENPLHREKFVYLLNAYIEDKMGGGIPFEGDREEELLRGISEHSTCFVVFALVTGEFAGMSVNFVNYSTFAAKKLVNIHDIIVIDKYRNKGIGRGLLEEVARLSKEMGCCKITLEVRHDNHNAMHLYKSLGFKDSDPPMYFWHKNL